MLRASLAGLVVATTLFACSSEEKLAGQGGECFQASDCQAGLACIPQKSGSSICSSDLSSVQSSEDAATPADAAAAGDGNAKSDGAAKGDGGASTDGGSAMDAGGAMDSASPPDSAPVDSAPPPDSAASMDAAAD